MKSFLYLIVLTTLVAQLPQFQAAPTDLDLNKLFEKAILQSYIEKLLEAQQQEDAMMQGEKVYSRNCPPSFMHQSALQKLKDKIDTLSASAKSKVDIEFHCENPKSYMTSITDKASGSYYKWVELRYQYNTGTCRGGGSDRIRIGDCPYYKPLTNLGKVTIPVGNTGKDMTADVFWSGEGGSLDCIAIENFNGPSCPGS